MDELTIRCPKCAGEIRLTESLLAPLLAGVKRQYDAKLAEKEAEVAEREAELQEKAREVREQEAAIDEQIADGLLRGRQKIAEEEAKRARQAVVADLAAKDAELASLREGLENSTAKISQLSKAQAELILRERQLAADRDSLELSVEKRVSEKLEAVRSQARRDAEEDLRLKVVEKEQQIVGMQRQIEELKRRSEQGSQQLQGEVLELELEKLLAATFPMDRIEPVPKGEFGGDTVQRVLGPLGQLCGTILWESKRTKNWSDSWLQKLRDDQRAAKAELAVLVSRALPKEVEAFALVEGVWVAHPRYALALAAALRQTLIEVSLTRKAGEGQQTKMGLLYDYLVGPRFRQRVQAIVEAFSSMKEDLDRERKAIIKQWAKREEQITRVMQSTAGLYGDLQGIAGASIQEIEGLSLAQLEGGEARRVPAEDD